MRVTLRLPTALQRFAEGQREIKVDVTDPTVGAVIAAIGARYPGIADRALDDQGNIRRHVNVFVDDENTRFTGGLAAAVNEGSEVSILPAVSGG